MFLPAEDPFLFIGKIVVEIFRIVDPVLNNEAKQIHKLFGLIKVLWVTVAFCYSVWGCVDGFSRSEYGEHRGDGMVD
ncbi:MAG: hypothetical protein ACT6FG_01255 [Methanosarcinaceae archaeon]